MANKKIIASVTGVAVIGVLSYLGYRVLKQLNDIDFDFMGENMYDYYDTSTSDSCPQSDAECKEPKV